MGLYLNGLEVIEADQIRVDDLYLDALNADIHLDRTSANVLGLADDLDLNADFDQDPAAKSDTPGTTGAWFDQGAQTFTDNNTAASGTAAAMVFNAFQIPTLAATNLTVTTTDAATLYIAGAPTAGDNQTITNAWALWNAGSSRLDGATQLNSTLAVGVDDTGYDVTFYGATAGAYMLWDESEDGLIIDQSTDDANILEFRSSTDVAHGMTVMANTATYGFVQKHTADQGGLVLAGLRDAATTGLTLLGIGVTDVTAKLTTSHGYVILRGYKKDTTSVVDPGANANLVTVEKGSNVTAIFDTDGDFHTTDVVCGLGEGSSTGAALTGGSIRAPHYVGGTTDDVAGADFTIEAGQGTGAGDVGQIIFNTPRVQAAGSTVHTLTTLLTLDEATATLAGTLALGANNLTLTGTISATGARVTQSYHTNITSTNAVTVDSSATVKHNITPYLGDALSVVRGMTIITYEHDAWLDPSNEVKLGILSESVMEPMALRPIHHDGAADYMGINMYGLATLNTRAIQMLDKESEARFSTVEERLEAVEEANRILRGQLQQARVLPEA